MSVEFKDNSKEVLQDLAAAEQAVLTAWGIKAEKYAKAETPVDTGRLRNSITYVTDAKEKEMIVGSNVEYAPFVELDDKKRHNVGNAHFLRNSIQNHKDEYKQIMKKILK